VLKGLKPLVRSSTSNEA